MGVLKRLAVFALIFNLVLFWGVLGLMLGTGGNNIGAVSGLAMLLWLLCFPVLILGYAQKDRQRSRRVCGAGLVMFALMLGCMGYSFWYHANGVWQPWGDLYYSNVQSVELRSQDGNAVVVLTEAEAERACALAAELRVQNPCVYTWGEMRIPEGMPAVSGVYTDILMFWKGNGEPESLRVGYPYYNQAHLAADLEKCREAEEFINGLSDKYFPKEAAVE